MGRYYSGDIEGKFMFAVQGSDAGTRFGAFECSSGYIEYCVNRESYKDIVRVLASIKSRGHVDKVKNMFEKVNGYNDKIMEEHGVTRKDLSEYADYNLGEQMKVWFDENEDEDSLYFNAEL